MTQIVLFHSVLGQTPGFTGFADRLREAGHTVHTPDLFEGRTFASIEDGMAHVEGLGFEATVERGVRAAEALPAEVVYAGFSLGVMPAEKLTVTRPGARGAVFVDACADPSYFGTWPEGVPVQVHGMEADPIFADEGDLDAARALAGTAGAELFVYAGDAHLFADSSMPWHDPEAAALLTERVLEFLDRVG
jgi:dienelactone hydrolase